MSDTWEIMIQYSFGRYNTFLSIDPRIYEGIKQEGQKNGLHFVAGKKGIVESDIERVRKEFSALVKRLNTSEHLDLKRELERIVTEPELAEPRPQPL